MLSIKEILSENRDELLGIISNISEQNLELIAANEELNASIHSLETQNEQLASRLHLLEEQLRLLKYKRFCKSSERTVPEQRNLFDEAEVIAELEPAEEVELQTIIYERKKRGRKPLPQNLTRERVEYELPEEEQYCSCCGGQMHKIGEEVRSELNILPAQLRKR